MYLYEINNENRVEEFKKQFSHDNPGVYWIYLIGKELPDDTHYGAINWAYAMCPAVQIQSGSRPIIKPKNCPQIDFGNDFESAQKAIRILVNCCLLTHSIPDKIGPRNSIYLQENGFRLDVMDFPDCKKFYDVGFAPILAKNIHNFTNFQDKIERHYSSFKSVDQYDAYTRNKPSVAQRERNYYEREEQYAEREEANREIKKKKDTEYKIKNQQFDQDHKALNIVMLVLKFILYPIPFVGIIFFVIDKIVRKRPEQIRTRFYVMIILFVYGINACCGFRSLSKMINFHRNDNEIHFTYQDLNPSYSDFD